MIGRWLESLGIWLASDAFNKLKANLDAEMSARADLQAQFTAEVEMRTALQKHLRSEMAVKSGLLSAIRSNNAALKANAETIARLRNGELA